jgi:hypothetical protein
MGVVENQHSNGLFGRDGENIWHVKTPDAQLYMKAEMEKIQNEKNKIEMRVKKRLSKKKNGKKEIITDCTCYGELDRSDPTLIESGLNLST